MGSLKSVAGKVQALADQAQQLASGDGLVERFGPYRDRPVAFVREQLGATPESYQVAILSACAREPRIAWRAGHGVGKTTTLSWTLLWWLLTRPFSRVLILAPAFERQVGRYLLPEVRKWARRAPSPLPVYVERRRSKSQGTSADGSRSAYRRPIRAKSRGRTRRACACSATSPKGSPPT